MKITVITVGKVKEIYFKNAIAEYTSRIKNYASFHKIDIVDEKIIESKPDNLIKEKEAEKILKVLQFNSFKIALTDKGSKLTSIKFAEFIEEIKDKSYPELTFIIGGTLGLSDSVLKKVDFKLSLSEMTLPHQMAYLFLAEQIYRAFKIINNEPYHK